MRTDEDGELLAEFAEYLQAEIIRPAVDAIRGTIADAVRASAEPETTRKMWGAYFREAAVLVLVFVPIELLYPRRPYDRKWLGWFALTLVSSYILLRFGMWLERSRR
jgi:hypothetical protein